MRKAVSPKQEIYLRIKEYALRLARRGYLTVYGGNISVRKAGRLFITRHACSPEDIKPEDIIEIPVRGSSRLESVASADTFIHRAIYKMTPHLAVVHAHTPYAITLSFFYNKIVPLDIEGNYILKEIPVVEGKLGSTEIAEKVSKALKSHSTTIVRGHGVFAGAESLDMAYQLILMVEHSSQILYLTETLKRKGLQFKTPRGP